MYSLARMGPGTPLFGLAVQNLGPGMRFLDQTNNLPLTLAAGLGYALPVGLTLAADFKHRPYSAVNEFSIGTEYAVFSTLAFRFGYASRAAAIQCASTGGIGLSELGNVQRLSLGARF